MAHDMTPPQTTQTDTLPNEFRVFDKNMFLQRTT